jgi:hypothetical protein
VGASFYVSDTTYAVVPAATLTDNAAVTVTSAEAALATANAALKSLSFTKIGSDLVAIGFTGITWLKRCIIQNEGDT